MSKKQKKVNKNLKVETKATEKKNEESKVVNMKIVPPAPETPKEESEKKEEKVDIKKGDIKVIDVSNLEQKMATSTNGLDRNHQVDLLKMMHETFRLDKDAAARYGMSQEAVEEINRLNAIGQVTVLANEVVNGGSDFAVRMRLENLNRIKEIASTIGVKIIENALPAPVEGVVEVPSKAIKVSTETKKALKAEQKAEDSEVLDPKSIKTKEELVTALVQFLAKRSNIHESIQQAISFYREYLLINAEDTEEVKKMTHIELLNKIIDVVESAPIVMNGIGNFLYSATSCFKSPISSFCQFRNTTLIKGTGEPTMDDAEVADIVKTLIIWACRVKKRAAETSIVEINKNLEVLKKDANKNSAAIKEQEEKIETQNSNIKHFADVEGYVTDAPAEFLTNFLENYDKKEPAYMKTFNAIVSTMYPKVNLDEIKKDSLKKNVEQYAGIITNMFRSPLSQMINYNRSNITELEKIESEKN